MVSPLLTDEAVLAQVVRDSPLAVVISALADGQVLDVNESFLQLFGYTRDEAIGQSAVGLGLWADPEQRVQLAASIALRQPVRDFEACVRVKSGAERQVRATVTEVELDGRACLVIQMHDVTAHWQEQLQVRALLGQLSVITYTSAADDPRHLTSISPEVESILGYSPAEILANQSDFLVPRTHPAERERVRSAVEQALLTQSPIQIEHRVQTRGDRWVWFRDEAVLVRDPHRHPLLWQGVLVDITSRRAAEDALRKSEERFRALVQNSHDVTVVLDAAGRRKYVSPSVEHLLGYAASDMVGKSPVDIVHPDDAQTLWRAIETCLDGARTIPVFELRIRHADGSWREFEVSGTNLLEEPSVAGIVLNSRDVSARKFMERALREGRERFTAVWESASDAMTLSDPDGIVLAVNPAYCALFGYSLDELVGHKFSVVFPKEARELVDAQYRAMFTDSGTLESYEVRVQRKDGSERDVEVSPNFIVRDGQRVALISVVRDVTERRAAEAAQRESEERFRSAFDHAPIGIALVGPDARFIQVNRALCQLAGYTEQELLDKTFPQICHPDDLADDLEQSLLFWAGEIETYQLEKRLIHKDGHIVWILFTGSIIRYDNLPRFAIFQMLDITDRRRLEMDRAVMLASEREYSKQLRTLNEMRADLTAMIAHELRAPVSALRMMTFLLAGGGLSPDDEVQMFSAVRGEIDQLDRLVSDVAALTAAEREDLSVQLHPVSLTLLLQSAASFAATVLKDHLFTMEPAHGTRVWCDPERINQVLRNLLDNAAKHTPPGTSIALRAHREGMRVQFEVADNGPGLSATDLDRIFEKFGRGDDAATRQTYGAGIGLYVSRKIIQAHGSDLVVESTPGAGTVFAFDLEVAS